MPPTRLQIAKKDIFAEFDRANSRVFTTRQIAAILSANREFWRLANSTTVPAFIKFLLASERLREVQLECPRYSPLSRFVWGDASPFEVALSIKPNSYLSHGTAIFLHNLTNEIPRTIYVNQEQSAKPARRSLLTQEGLDRAFRAKQRTSNLVYLYGESQVVVLAGKFTEQLEVGTLPIPSGQKVAATKLERTLIDSVVRPSYAGGVHHVLEAFAAAREVLSTNVLVATLKKLDYVYPYHQAIGFYMKRAGFGESRYTRLKDLGIKLDFYLVHGATATEYDEEWKLRYPKGL